MGDEVDDAEPVVPPKKEEAEAEVSGPEELSTGLKLTLSEKVIEEVWASGEDVEAQKELLMGKLREIGAFFEEFDAASFQHEVICDFHLQNMIYCKSICLSARKTAVFHAIMQQVLESMRRKSNNTTHPGESYTNLETFHEFQELMVAHAVNQPPEQIEVFLGSEGRLLTDHTTLTFFKHYLLYQYCLIFPREVETLRTDVKLESPLPPPPLNTAKEILPEGKEKSGGYSSKQAPAKKRADENQPPTSNVDPAVEAFLDQKLAAAESKLESKLQEQEEKFMETLQNRTRK